MNDLLSIQYSINKKIRFKTPILILDSCNYSDSYIAVKGRRDLLAAAANEYDKAGNDFIFKNNAPSTLCISKINRTFLDNAGGADIVMSIYGLLE